MTRHIFTPYAGHFYCYTIAAITVIRDITLPAYDAIAARRHRAIPHYYFQDATPRRRSHHTTPFRTLTIYYTSPLTSARELRYQMRRAVYSFFFFTRYSPYYHYRLLIHAV